MDTAQKTIHIKWVRSGIGFDRSQSEVVHSLGLRRLNHVVERPDTPQVRGLVAKVTHLVAVVRGPSEPAWNSTPAYTIKAAVSEPKRDTDSLPRPVEISPVSGYGQDGSATDRIAATEEGVSASELSPSSQKELPDADRAAAAPTSEESLSHQDEDDAQNKEKSEKI